MEYFTSNIYEVNLRQYTPEGTIQAFKEHLPRLQEMGIDIVWFMPITPISTLNRKGTLGSYYACSDYTSINPEFGDLNDFKDLVSTAHSMGMKVIIDWVANHTGWDHTWTISHPEYYLKNDHGQFSERNGWEDVIDLNYNNFGMRQALIDAMKFWVQECNIDGYRCDMAMLVTVDFWKEAKKQVDELKPCIWLAECEDQNYFEVFDILYAWEWMHGTRNIANHSLDRNHIANLIQHYTHKTPFNKYFLYFTSNHDENSWNGTEHERYGEHAMIYAILSMLMPGGVPLIYSGQELPVKHRLKFFDKDVIDWNQTCSMDYIYHSFLLLRKTFETTMHTELNSMTSSEKIFTLRIKKESHPSDILFIVNLSPQEENFSIQVKDVMPRYKNLLTNEMIHLSGDDFMRLEKFDFRLYVSF